MEAKVYVVFKGDVPIDVSRTYAHAETRAKEWSTPRQPCIVREYYAEPQGVRPLGEPEIHEDLCGLGDDCPRKDALDVGGSMQLSLDFTDEEPTQDDIKTCSSECTGGRCCL